MASYKDWFNIENPNLLNERSLKKAISSMGSAANKRLRRMEERGIYFGDVEGPETLSGVKKFTVRGKSLDELKREFKRVRNFLDNPQSSLTGMKKVFRDFKKTVKKSRAKRLTRAERKDYEKMRKQKEKSGITNNRRLTQWEELKQWRETWKYYNRLVEEGYYSPTEYDSTQVRETILANVAYSYEESLTEDETWQRLLNDLQYDYETRKSEEIEEDDNISTSSFIFGSSD